jgi:hypothetical protein
VFVAARPYSASEDDVTPPYLAGYILKKTVLHACDRARYRPSISCYDRNALHGRLFRGLLAGFTEPPGARCPEAEAMNAETIQRLNELLEAECAGVETLQALLKTVPKGYFRNHLVKIEADEAFSCAVLTRAVVAAGGEPSPKTGDFAAKVLALDALSDRLKLLSRGQTWVVKRVDAVAEAVADEDSRAELREMRREHVDNVAWCDEQAAELTEAGVG